MHPPSNEPKPLPASHNPQPGTPNDNSVPTERLSKTDASPGHRVPVIPVLEPKAPSKRVGVFFLALLGVALALPWLVSVLFLKKTVELPAAGTEEFLTTMRISQAAVNANDVQLIAPERVVRGETFSVRVIAKNSNEEALFFTSQGPTGGAFTSLQSEVTERVDAGSETTMQLDVRAESAGAWRLQYTFKNQKNAEAENVVLYRSVLVTEPELAAWIDVGDEAEVRVPRSRLVPLTLHLENTSRFPLLHSRVILTSKVSGVVMPTVRLPATLWPGAKRSMRLTLRLPQSRAVGSLVSFHELGISASLRTVVNAPGVPTERELFVDANPALLDLHAFARAYDAKGKRITEGPLPLSTGVATQLWINLSLPKHVRAIENIEAIARLAPGVTLTGRTWANTGDTLALDTTNGRVTWKTHGPLPRSSRGNVPLAGFEIEYTPGDEVAGEIPALLSALEATASTLRLEAGTKISIQQPRRYEGVSADLRFDDFANDPGVARKYQVEVRGKE